MAVKMQKEYGDKLNTIFVESQGHRMEQVQKLALSRKWLGSSAIWTTERPIRSGGRGLPSFVMLSPEGEVVMRGNPLAMHKKVEEYLDSLSRPKSVRVPKDLPRPLHGAFKDFAKGRFGSALHSAEKIAAKQTEDSALSSAAEELAAEARARIEGKLGRIDRAIESGAFVFAKAECKRVGKLVRGSSMASELESRLAKLASDDLETEVKAEKSLVRITDKLYAKGAAPATKKQLVRLAKKYSGTIAAGRAEELASLLE